MLLSCCDKPQKAKTLILPQLSYVWREFVYLECCEHCHSSRAEIHAMTYDGILLTPNQWRGETAKKKYKKYSLESRELIKNVETGSKNYMYWLYFNGSNTMYDLNGKNRGKFDDKLTVSKIPACELKITPSPQ